MPDTGSMIDRRHWDEKHRDSEYLGDPAPFLVECGRYLPRGRALDVACGLGANALHLANQGFDVDALDWSFEGLRKLTAAAREKSFLVRALCCDLTRFPLPEGRYDVVLCFRYLERSLFPSLVAALKPGGALVIGTFNQRYRENRPDFPREYCLEEGELLSTFGATLRVARYQELPRETTAALLAFR